jgi:hypothetical protein
MSLPQIAQIHAEKNKIEIIEYQKKTSAKISGFCGEKKSLPQITQITAEQQYYNEK